MMVKVVLPVFLMTNIPGAGGNDPPPEQGGSFQNWFEKKKSPFHPVISA